MKLVKVEDLRDILGTRDIDEINQMLATALDQVTVAFENALNFRFEEVAAHLDHFFLDPTNPQYDADFVKLNLSRGFLSTTVTAVVRFSSTYVDLANADVITDDVIVDTYKGMLTVMTCPAVYQDRYASVTYTSGFTVEDTEYGSVATSVPGWLESAAIAHAADVCKHIREWSAESNKPFMLPISDSVWGMLRTHVKYNPMAYQALEAS
jgi:hypothetical protein